MRTVVKPLSWDHGRQFGIRREEKSSYDQNTLQVKEFKINYRRSQKPGPFISMDPTFQRRCQYSQPPHKLRARRKRQKPYITTEADIEKRSCSDSDQDGESRGLYGPSISFAIKKERNRGSLPSSSSTPRVQSCAEPQESQHSEATDNLVRTNQSLSGLGNNNFQTFEFKSQDPKISPVTMHGIACMDDSRPIRQLRKTATHQGPLVHASAHIRPHSVPKSTRRFSDPSHVYGKVLSLGSEISPVSSQPVNQSSLSDKFSPGEPHDYASSADEMSHLSRRADVPTAHKNVESSPRHIEDNSSMFEFSILYNQWRYISRIRTHVQTLRFKLQIKRRELRILQREKSLAEDAYFKQVQMRELNMPFPRAWWSEKTIAELLNDSQKARNEYGSLEDEYIQIEDDLDSQEWELSQQENHFYSQLLDPSRFFRGPINSEYAAKSQDEPEHFEPHPLVDAYLLKLGGLDNLRESFDETLDEKLDLEEQLAVRKRFNMTLMPEDQQWLDSSQSQLDDLASKIQVAETEERELRQQCLSLGLIDENCNPIEPSKHERHSLSTDTAPETLENPRESVQILSLLPPEPSDMEIGIKALDFGHNYSSRNERFDRWSLEKLQVSLLEINIYANCFENYDDLTDLSKLKETVHDDDFVTAWFADGFTDSASRSTGFTSIHSTPQHIPCANLDSKVSPYDSVFSNAPHSESDHSNIAEGG
ncbi:d4019a24-49b8-40ca-8871-78fed547cfd5-CDS [Sclerotinia trifoliorum]|uniref:D4019a24-49b8-40ca-8871-78fed547cfd5-CDS n=1 Tax=Sclerotinia trifoliorum TaxID=28548 RepID=A0A8H2VZ94_9HELO|nr:d4019a24-49b8-40ca-8871-78fed547cfd5-CDS [Sclerotinia trifoliorum]